jgi:hypothetical protein
MPITIAGQVIGIPPRFVNRNRIEILEDFVAGGANGASSDMANSGIEWFNAANTLFPDRVGVLACDWSLGSGAISALGSPKIQLNLFATVEWQCAMYFSGFDISGGRNQAFGVGIGDDTDGCDSANWMGFRAASASVAVCGSALPSDNRLHAVGQGPIFSTVGSYFGSVAIADIVGKFVTLKMVYTRAVPSIAYYIDGALIGTNTTASKIPDAAFLYAFNPGGSRTVSNPAVLQYFDYFRFVGTLPNR